MKLWNTRESSLRLLEGELSNQHKAITGLFEILDLCIDRYSNLMDSAAYFEVCGIATAKARNLALGLYGMILDGLGQEAGALMRPLIEYNELLTYFRVEPKRIVEALNDDLPSAGKRAEKIEGIYKEYRSHLNDHSSHSSFSKYSTKHLLDEKTGRLRKEQPLIQKTLERNLRDFWVQIILMTEEAILSLAAGGDDRFEEIAVRFDKNKTEGLKTFKLEKKDIP